MTIAALVLAVDALTAVFLLGLVHCRDVTPPLPRRVPGATLVDNPPRPTGILAIARWMDEQPTIGQRAHLRRLTVEEFYRQKFEGAS